MANYAPETPLLTGLIPTFRTAAGGGDSFDNNGKVLVEFVNGSGASITVTFDAPNPDNFGITDDSHDVAIVLTAGQRRIIGPFSPNRFNDANGRVQMAFSGVTSLTFAVFYTPQAG